MYTDTGCQKCKSVMRQRTGTCFSLFDAEALCVVIAHAGVSGPSFFYISWNSSLCEESSLLRPLLQLSPGSGVRGTERIAEARSQLRPSVKGRQVQKCQVCNLCAQTQVCKHRPSVTAGCRWMAAAPRFLFAFWRVLYHGYGVESLLPQNKVIIMIIQLKSL